ncbi:hypothetical protein C8J57DRAFT_1343700 [Mycena rebaudengoi]|nr:hypothetical protein C8J57DRAFT_1343700 [Mycena rebaudengoi]
MTTTYVPTRPFRGGDVLLYGMERARLTTYRSFNKQKEHLMEYGAIFKTCRPPLPATARSHPPSPSANAASSTYRRNAAYTEGAATYVPFALPTLPSDDDARIMWSTAFSTTHPVSAWTWGVLRSCFTRRSIPMTRSPSRVSSSYFCGGGRRECGGIRRMVWRSSGGSGRQLAASCPCVEHLGNMSFTSRGPVLVCLTSQPASSAPSWHVELFLAIPC